MAAITAADMEVGKQNLIKHHKRGMGSYIVSMHYFQPLVIPHTFKVAIVL